MHREVASSFWGTAQANDTAQHPDTFFLLVPPNNIQTQQISSTWGHGLVNTPVLD